MCTCCVTDSPSNAPEWTVDTLELLKTSSSDEEFFDAQGKLVSYIEELRTKTLFLVYLKCVITIEMCECV